MADARHTQKSPEWGTPPWVCELARDIMGSIDLDPASDAKWNETVKANSIFTKEQNGLSKSWHGRTFLNPPGTGRGSFKTWWNKLFLEWGGTSTVSHFFLVGYNMDHLRNPGMGHFTCIVPHKRINYEGAGKSAGMGSFFLTDIKGPDISRALAASGRGCNVFLRG